MYPILFAALSLPRAVTDPASNPLEAVGWSAAVYAVLRILWAQFGDKLPALLQTLISKIPTFPGKDIVVPLVVPTLSDAIKQFVDSLLAQKIPRETVSALAGELVTKLVPIVNDADVKELKSAVAAKCGPAPTVEA